MTTLMMILSIAQDAMSLSNPFAWFCGVLIGGYGIAFTYHKAVVAKKDKVIAAVVAERRAAEEARDRWAERHLAKLEAWNDRANEVLDEYRKERPGRSGEAGGPAGNGT